MLYLFNDASTNQGKNIWLTSDGISMFASKTSPNFSQNPQGSQLVGKINSDEPSDFLLAFNGRLTENGKKYCTILGIEKTGASLAKFVEKVPATRRSVDIAAIVPQSAQPA